MSIITLKSISHENKVSKNGKAYISCKLTVFSNKENKDLFISGFGSEITKTWGAGDIIDVNLSQTEKGYWNFEENENTKPSPDKKLLLLQEINRKLDILLGGSIKSENGEIKPEDIPF